MTLGDWLADLRYGAYHPWARAALWVCTAALLGALAAAAYWWPARQGQHELEDQIAAKRRQLVGVRQAEQLLQAYRTAAKDVALLEKKLAQAATQAQLVENLARLARRHGVRVVSETYEEGRGGAQPTLTTDLAVQGTYRALRDFVRDFPALPTWSEVQEVSLERVRETDRVKGRIRIVTYRRGAVGKT